MKVRVPIASLRSSDLVEVAGLGVNGECSETMWFSPT